MPEKGSVVRRRRRVGFGAAESEGERFVIVSVGELNAALPTWVVAPIEGVTELFARMDYAVPITSAESGATHDAVIVCWSLAALPAHRFDPVPCGRLLDSTLEQVDYALRGVLGLD